MTHSLEEIELTSGAKGILVEVPDAPVAVFSFNFMAGYFTAPSDKWEVPHVLEHLMFNGNKFFPTSQEFNLELEKNGAYASAFTGHLYVNYISECADFEAPRVAELVLQSLASPLFLEDEFKAEMGNVHEELSGFLNSYFRVLNLALMEANGLQVLSDSKRIDLLGNITRDDIVAHHAKTHTASNLRFIIGGQISKHRSVLIDLLEDYTKKLPQGKERFPAPVETVQPTRKALVMPRQDVEKLHYYLDMYLPSRRLEEKEAWTASLIKQVLTDSMTSRIFGEARRRGLAYGLSSRIHDGANYSRWYFGGNVNIANTEPLFELIAREVKSIADGGLTKKELDAAKLQAIGQFQRGSQKVSDLVYGYSDRYYFEEVIDDYGQIPSRINSVTLADIKALSKEFIEERAWSIGFLGRINQEEADKLSSKFSQLFQ